MSFKHWARAGIILTAAALAVGFITTAFRV